MRFLCSILTMFALAILPSVPIAQTSTYENPVDGKEYTTEWETYEPELPKDDLDSRVSIENVVLLTLQEDLAKRVSVESLSTYIEQLETYLLELATDSNDHGKVWLQVEIEQEKPPAYQLAYDGSVSEELLQAYYNRISGNENVPAVLGPVSFQLVMVVRDRSALPSAITPE